MLIVRSGKTWDNPRNEFITEEEDIAKAVIDAHNHARFEKHKRDIQFQLNHLQERIDFKQYQISQGKVVDDFDEHYESYDAQRARLNNSLNLPYEEWLLEWGKSADWFYEEVAVYHHDMEMALDHYKRVHRGV